MEEQTVRVITWNCNKATASRATWDYFLDLKPDIALLQEVASIPESVRGAYKVVSQHAIRKNGSKQTFETSILTKTSNRYCLFIGFAAPVGAKGA
jgi:exonuclease III